MVQVANVYKKNEIDPKKEQKEEKDNKLRGKDRSLL